MSILVTVIQAIAVIFVCLACICASAIFIGGGLILVLGIAVLIFHFILISVEMLIRQITGKPSSGWFGRFVLSVYWFVSTYIHQNNRQK